MIASYRIKCHYICSIPNKILTKKQTSNSFFMFNKFYSKLNPLRDIQFGYYFNSFMSKCDLRISMHLFLAQQYVFHWPILCCLVVAATFWYHSNSFLPKTYNFSLVLSNKEPQLLHLLTCLHRFISS